MGRLDGKVAVVTGTTSGIGEATAWLFAREGAKVVMGARRIERGEKMEKEMKAEGLDAIFVKTDVRVPSECAGLIKKAVDTYGRIDILANVAGVSGGRPYKLHEVDNEIRAREFETNLYGTIDTCTAAIPYMLSQKSGSIVNVASVAGIVAIPNDCIYSASKGAVKMLSISMAYDYAKDGIRVNCVCPGLTLTEMGGLSDMVKANAASGDSHSGGGLLQKVLDAQPLGRLAAPIEIAQGILFLASDEASFACGTVLTIDGGEIIA